MKTYSILLIFVLFLSCTPKEPTPSDSINPIIGNQSYLEKLIAIFSNTTTLLLLKLVGGLFVAS